METHTSTALESPFHRCLGLFPPRSYVIALASLDLSKQPVRLHTLRLHCGFLLPPQTTEQRIHSSLKVRRTLSTIDLLDQTEHLQ